MAAAVLPYSFGLGHVVHMVHKSWFWVVLKGSWTALTASQGQIMELSGASRRSLACCLSKLRKEGLANDSSIESCKRKVGSDPQLTARSLFPWCNVCIDVRRFRTIFQTTDSMTWLALLLSSPPSWQFFLPQLLLRNLMGRPMDSCEGNKRQHASDVWVKAQECGTQALLAHRFCMCTMKVWVRFLRIPKADERKASVSFPVGLPKVCPNLLFRKPNLFLLWLQKIRSKS